MKGKRAVLVEWRNDGSETADDNQVELDAPGCRTEYTQRRHERGANEVGVFFPFPRSDIFASVYPTDDFVF